MTELTILVIGEWPSTLPGVEGYGQVYFTRPTQMVSICPRESMHANACRVDLSQTNGMVVHAIVSEHSSALSDSVNLPPQEELYSGFEVEAQQQLDKADALETDTQRKDLKELFYEFQGIFSRDSYDCGITDIQSVCLPTDPNAPPTFVSQDKIPLATFESIQGILDSLLEKKIIKQ